VQRCGSSVKAVLKQCGNVRKDAKVWSSADYTVRVQNKAPSENPQAVSSSVKQRGKVWGKGVTAM